ncbi:hypothetical protein ILUMI_22384 [Ignelater luminosus]|uniref:Uncharacterized protein n=1 Tax=Ignelater luminosus TaxID=2038154 RepID=A0A8K0G2Z1_IGNLU|nr:hypothetical protein ILUMI_22384 [Ignelater luminosus]
MEGQDGKRPGSTKPNSTEGEEEQQPLLQENKEENDNKDISSTSADECGMYDEAVGGPSMRQPLMAADRPAAPDSTCQARRRAAVANSFRANWEKVIERAREAQRQEQLMKDLFDELQQPRELITADLHLRYGQHIMLASACFRSYAESPTSPRENFLAIAVSYSEGANHDSWINDSKVTGVIDTSPRIRSVFCIRS